jgi:hypothetical protein
MNTDIMLSDNKRQKLIYRILRWLLFVISIPISLVALTFSTGSAVDAVIWRNQHSGAYVLIHFMIAVFLSLFFMGLLFMIGKICNVKVPATTYVWLAVPPFCSFFMLLVNMGYQA